MSDKDRKPGAGPENESEQPESQQESKQGSTSGDLGPGIEGPTRIVTGADVEAAVRGLVFPAPTRDLIERARQNGAEEHVIDRIAELPDRKVNSLGDALRQLDMLS
jgi:hypothetical protein